MYIKLSSVTFIKWNQSKEEENKKIFRGYKVESVRKLTNSESFEDCQIEIQVYIHIHSSKEFSDQWSH